MFQGEGITCVKALRKREHIPGTKVRPLYLKIVIKEMKVKLAGSRSLGTMNDSWIFFT